jgi:hypothetical protein
MKTLIRISIAIAVCGAALLWKGDVSWNMQQEWVSSAHARIGRPLTPMSYAGVARRTTRRAVRRGAYYGAAAGAYYGAPAAPGCVQAVDAYGRIYTRCY